MAKREIVAVAENVFSRPKVKIKCLLRIVNINHLVLE